MCKMKKLFISLFILLTVFTLVSCKDKDSAYKYPEKTPIISNANETFVGKGEWKVTNEQAYVKLVSQYGYEEILSWLDETVFYSTKLNNENNTEFEKFLNLQKYGVENTVLENFCVKRAVRCEPPRGSDGCKGQDPNRPRGGDVHK